MVSARNILKASMQGAWKRPEFESIANSERQETQGAYADCLRKLMKAGNAGDSSYEQCAEEAGLRNKFKQLWQA